MKKMNAAPIAIYPTKNRKKVIVSSVLPSINRGNPLSPTGLVALTVPAIARANVATNSRLVVLEKRSNDILSFSGDIIHYKKYSIESGINIAGLYVPHSSVSAF